MQILVTTQEQKNADHADSQSDSNDDDSGFLDTKSLIALTLCFSSAGCFIPGLIVGLIACDKGYCKEACCCEFPHEIQEETNEQARATSCSSDDRL